MMADRMCFTVDRRKLFQMFRNEPEFVRGVMQQDFPSVLIAGTSNLREDIRLEMIGISLEPLCDAQPS